MREEVKLERITCDRCLKNNVPGTTTVYIDTGRRCDAAGDMEDVTLTCELCPSCMKYVINCTLSVGQHFTVEDLKKELKNFQEN